MSAEATSSFTQMGPMKRVGQPAEIAKVAVFFASGDSSFVPGNEPIAGAYVPCLFWAHLTIEKPAKALWVKDNAGDTPPFTHNISKLLTDTSLLLTPVEARFGQQLNTFQLAGRYESYTTNLRQLATRAFPQAVLQDVSRS